MIEQEMRQKENLEITTQRLVSSVNIVTARLREAFTVVVSCKRKVALWDFLHFRLLQDT